MRAADVRGHHAAWRGYVNGPADYEALERIHGIGPARAGLILRVFGSVDAFLQADSEAVARRTLRVIGPGLAGTLQERCRAAGVASDWSRLEELATREESYRSTAERLMARLEALGRAWRARTRAARVPSFELLDRLRTGP